MLARGYRASERATVYYSFRFLFNRSHKNSLIRGVLYVTSAADVKRPRTPTHYVDEKDDKIILKLSKQRRREPLGFLNEVFRGASTFIECPRMNGE